MASVASHSGSRIRYANISLGRGNKRDPNTYAQWLKEVKPNAAVIDTGYKGTVLNWIRDKDTSATGFYSRKITM